MSKAEIIKILETRKKPVNVTQLVKLTGKGRSVISQNVKGLLDESKPMIGFVVKKEWHQSIRYYFLINEKNRSIYKVYNIGYRVRK